MLHLSLAAATAAASPSYASAPPLQAGPASASPPARRRPGRRVAVRCAPQPSPGDDAQPKKLKIGSPIVILEAPTMLKTAASVPSLRHNGGQVKPGDVGRILARKPKDVWAVRLAVGTFLLDGKFFKPLDVVNGDEAPDES